MAFQKSDLDRVRRFALSVVQIIEMHEDNDSDHECGDTLDFIEGDLEKLYEELEVLNEMVDWESIL
jgi:hypothetical protein